MTSQFMKFRKTTLFARSTWRPGDLGVGTKSMRAFWKSGRIYFVRMAIGKYYCVNEVYILGEI